MIARLKIYLFNIGSTAVHVVCGGSFCRILLTKLDTSAEIYRVYYSTSMYRPRLYNLPPTAPMGGGTLLFEGAHLIDAIRPFVAKQENVVITPLFFANPTIKFGKI